MDRRQFLTSLLACPVCAATASAADGPHWEYEGDHGAAKWGDTLQVRKRPRLAASCLPA